jgi:hypothetical protein
MRLEPILVDWCEPMSPPMVYMDRFTLWFEVRDMINWVLKVVEGSQVVVMTRSVTIAPPA